MQINILGPKEARPVSKNVLVFILAVICYFMCMSFTINDNDGKINDNKEDKISTSTSSIGPSDVSVIKPDSNDDSNIISPSKEETKQQSNKTNTNSIGNKTTITSTIAPQPKAEIKPEQKVIANTIQPSISPSSNNELRPSASISNSTKISDTAIKPANKEVSKKEIKKNEPSFQFVSAKYMEKRHIAKKDNTKTKPSYILDMVNKKADESKKPLAGSITNNNNIDSTTTSHTSINWLTWDEAMRKNAQSPRKIMVELYTDWCTWCVKMDKSTFKDPAIVQYVNENFYAVKFNAETRKDVYFKGQKFSYIQDGNKGYNLFSLYLTRGKLTYPSIVFLDETVNNPQPIKGFQSITTMDRVLQFFGEDFYKKMDWSLFNQSFESASR